MNPPGRDERDHDGYAAPGGTSYDGRSRPGSPISINSFLPAAFGADGRRRGGGSISCALTSASSQAATARGALARPSSQAPTSYAPQPSSAARSAGFHLRTFRHWRSRAGIMSALPPPAGLSGQTLLKHSRRPGEINLSDPSYGTPGKLPKHGARQGTSAPSPRFADPTRPIAPYRAGLSATASARSGIPLHTPGTRSPNASAGGQFRRPSAYSWQFPDIPTRPPAPSWGAGGLAGSLRSPCRRRRAWQALLPSSASRPPSPRWSPASRQRRRRPAAQCAPPWPGR